MSASTNRAQLRVVACPDNTVHIRITFVVVLCSTSPDSVKSLQGTGFPQTGWIPEQYVPAAGDIERQHCTGCVCYKKPRIWTSGLMLSLWGRCFCFFSQVPHVFMSAAHIIVQIILIQNFRCCKSDGHISKLRRGTLEKQMLSIVLKVRPSSISCALRCNLFMV